MQVILRIQEYIYRSKISFDMQETKIYFLLVTFVLVS